MDAIKKSDAPAIRDLRTRYVPGVRIRQGLLSMAPWFDLALIVLYLLLLQTRIVLQPGLVVELPAGRAEPGLYSPLIAVAVIAGPARAPVVKVYFDNVQYVMDDAKRMEQLRDALSSKRLQRGDTALTLYADRRIETRYLARLMQLAQEAGLQRINLGVQPGTMTP